MRDTKQKNAIYKIRKARGLSQKRLAELIGVSNQQISFLENGVRVVKEPYITLLAKALNCSTDEILGEKAFSELKEDFSEREKALIGIFRELSEQDQERIVAMFDVFAKQDVKKDAC